jgi:alginate O-acetyltransferase complex protein AlgI
MTESFRFLGFCMVVILAYYAMRATAWRQAVLVLANICFLATFYQSVWGFLPFVAFLVFTYAGLQLIQRWPRATFLPVLVVTIGGFVWLKRYAFVPPSLFLQFTYVTVGLSYILFRVLHLMIDTRSGDLTGRIGLLSFFNYTTNFTTLSAGPIQRFQDYRTTENPATRPPLSAADVAGAIERIARGLFKTNVLALLLSTLQSRMAEKAMVGLPGYEKLIPAMLMFVLYPLFIYCNFSGYIDIVIGIGRLLGVVLPENFDRPFAADNVIDFWSNRWHITLSGWLRTYVYNPLLVSLMRRFPSPGLESVWAVLAFFVTFFLVGLWHGQTPEFIFFGLLLGLGVSVNKIYQILILRRIGRKRYTALGRNQAYIAVSRGLTFTWNVFTMIWFWSNWQQIHSFKSTLGRGTIAIVWIAILACSTLLLAAWERIYERFTSAQWNNVPLLSCCVRAAWSTAMVVMILGISLLMNQPAPEIVYKAF